jgi:hypothetical protein
MVSASMLLSPALPASTLTPLAPPPLATIIRNVVARDEANQKELQSMQYHQSLHSEMLGDDGKVTKHEDVQMIIRPGARDEIQIVSATGDEIPSDPDQAAQKAKGDEAKRKNLRIALKDLAQRFVVTLAGTDVVNSQPAYVLAFEPRKDQPYQNQTEKILNQLHGKMWISAANYSVLRTQATLAHPVDIVFFLATINTLDFHYELQGPPGAMGPAEVRTAVVINAPFITIRQRMTVEMTQFSPRDNATASLP